MGCGCGKSINKLGPSTPRPTTPSNQTSTGTHVVRAVGFNPVTPAPQNTQGPITIRKQI